MEEGKSNTNLFVIKRKSKYKNTGETYGKKYLSFIYFRSIGYVVQ